MRREAADSEVGNWKMWTRSLNQVCVFTHTAVFLEAGRKHPGVAISY